MTKKIFWRFMAPAIIIIIGALIAYWLIINANPVKQQSPTPRIWNISAQSVHQGNYHPYILIYGHIKAPRLTPLKSEVVTDVQQVLVKKGMKVKAHQLLVQLNPTKLKIERDQTLAKIDEIKAQFEHAKISLQRHQSDIIHQKKLLSLAQQHIKRYRELYQNQTISEKILHDHEAQWVQKQLSYSHFNSQLNQAKTQLKLLNARLKQSQVQLRRWQYDLDHCQIRSPFDAKVVAVNIATREPVALHQTLVTLLPQDSLEVWAQMAPRYTKMLAQALTHHKPVFAWSHHDAIQLQLEYLSPDIAPKQLGQTVVFKLVTQHAHLAHNQVMPFDLQLPAIPHSFKLSSQGLYDQNSIYTIVNGQLKRVKVKLAGIDERLQHSRQVIVTSHQLKSGDQVMISRLTHAIDGLKVNVSGSAS